MHMVKPVDSERIIKAVEKTGKIATVEDHNVIGGLGSAVQAIRPARLFKGIWNISASKKQ